MSVLRLLSTGKSLVGLREQARPYHVSDEPLLPKFEVKENPFRATVLPAQPKDGLQAAAEKAAEPSPVEQVPAHPPAVAQQPAVQVRLHRQPLLKVGSRSGVGRRVGSLLSRLGGLVRRQPLVRPVSRPPEQTELRLEAVKVVRNDLSESDIEVVPRAEMKAPSIEGGQTGVMRRMEVPTEVAANSAWGRMSARVFGSGPER
jgi:hypothetical protein